MVCAIVGDNALVHIMEEFLFFLIFCKKGGFWSKISNNVIGRIRNLQSNVYYIIWISYYLLVSEWNTLEVIEFIQQKTTENGNKIYKINPDVLK